MRCSSGASSGGCPYLQLQLSGGLILKHQSAHSLTVVSSTWAWTTVSLNVTSSKLLFPRLSRVSVLLLVKPLTGVVGRRAYFDDICVTWKTGV